MAYNFAPYQSASRCVGTSRPGAVALSAFIKQEFSKTYLINIYSCREIYGGSGYSHHAEGRAIDQGVPTTASGLAIPSIGMPVIEMLGPHGKALGIDHMIYNRTIWAAAYPGGKYYTGKHPHRDHWHIGLTRTAAEKLNLTTIRATVLGTVKPPPEGIDMSKFLEIAGFKFYDEAKWPTWAKPSIIKAITSGIIHGKTFNDNPVDRLYDPAGAVTRAEIAVMLNRAGVLK